ncbi:GNAT family N-acetyltransferase [Geitlerinema splendidum]|jgi:GNAT superfamily N-acetyltransferase|nr:GNAT family N-acetyltransferase [Geitlerinema splendidum]
MDISYENLNLKSLKTVIEELAVTFTNQETMSKALAVPSQDLQEIFESFVPNSLENSYIAKDKNKVVGGMISNDFAFFFNSSFPEGLSFELQAIMELLTELEQRFACQFPELTREGASLYLYTVYVDKMYAEKGIGTNLYKMTEENARKRGFKNLVSISTGPISQHISIYKQGFKKIDEIKYENFNFKGKAVFSNLENKSCMIMTKKL